ncbi:MAG: LysE family translocator [Phormidesmis sp.]
MIDSTTLFTYLAVVLGFAFIPGPAVLMTLTRAASSGVKIGIATGLGIAIGDLIHTSMVVFGLSAIVMRSLLLFSFVKYLGAAYLIYLGYRAITNKSKIHGLPQQAQITPLDALKQGAIAEVLNPKSAFFFLSFLPQFVDPSAGAISSQLLVLGLSFVLIGLLSTAVYASFAGGIGRYLRRHPDVLRWKDRAVGGIFITLGVRLAAQKR